MWVLRSQVLRGPRVSAVNKPSEAAAAWMSMENKDFSAETSQLPKSVLFGWWCQWTEQPSESSEILETLHHAPLTPRPQKCFPVFYQTSVCWTLVFSGCAALPWEWSKLDRTLWPGPAQQAAFYGSGQTSIVATGLFLHTMLSVVAGSGSFQGATMCPSWLEGYVLLFHLQRQRHTALRPCLCQFP